MSPKPQPGQFTDRLRAKNSPPRVVIGILNWNGWRDTLGCLRSLEGMDYPNWTAIIVDNGSSDDSVKRLREAHPTVPIVENGRNLGFAAGCNVGIRYALDQDTDYLWLLNNDTAVERHALSAMVERAEGDFAVGAVGSVIHFMSEPTRIQAWGGGHINFWIGRSRLYTHAVGDAVLDYIFGASMLIRRAALESVGLFDEGYFMYWEETDYCFRLRAAGWRLATAPGAVVYHKGSASSLGMSDALDAYFTTSAWRFFRKFGKFPVFSLWTGVGLSMLKRILTGRWRSALAVWPGRLERFQGRDSYGC